MGHGRRVRDVRRRWPGARMTATRGKLVKRNLSYFVAGAAAAVGAYAFLVEPRWVEVRRVKVHQQDLHPALEGLRIGLLTDMHAGSRRSLAVVRRASALLMRQAPAFVAVTGDFAAEKGPGFEAVLRAMQGLKPPLGVYAVPGNHDHRMGIGAWRHAIEQAGLADLTNRATILEIGDARLCLAGVDDLAEGIPSLASLPDPDTRDLTILLAHNPDQAERARRAIDRVDLILSGHTHGGQIRLPGIGPIRSSVEHDDLYEEGLRRRPWTQVYTSRGLGMVRIQARLLTRPEVTVLELTGVPRPPISASRLSRRARGRGPGTDGVR